MSKFFIYCLLLWQGACLVSAENVFIEPTIFAQKSNESAKLWTMSEWKLNELKDPRIYSAKVQVFNIVNAAAASNALHTDVCLSSFCHHHTLSSHYHATKGKSEFKLYRWKLPWNGARKICDEEGGHLAIPRTDLEEAEILKMMLADSIDDAWIGIHDQFFEGDWITVLDEPLATTGWGKWSKLFPNNPDNYNGKQHCARIVRNGGGMDDDVCELRKSFVCKM